LLTLRGFLSHWMIVQLLSDSGRDSCYTVLLWVGESCHIGRYFSYFLIVRGTPVVLEEILAIFGGWGIVDRVLGFFSSRLNSPIPSPFGSGRGAHSLGGGGPNSDEGTDTVVL
jgi:hypothetical protein